MSLKKTFKEYVSSIETLSKKEREFDSLQSKNKSLRGCRDIVIQLADDTLKEIEKQESLALEIETLKTSVFELKKTLIDNLLLLEVDFGCNILSHIDDDEYNFRLVKDGHFAEIEYHKL